MIDLDPADMRFFALILGLVYSGAAAAPLAGLLPAAAQTPGSASVNGRVIEEGTGAPIPNARVVLTPAGRTPMQVLTDSDGRYGFGALDPGQYQLTAEKVGYVKLDVRRSAAFRLAAGQTIESAIVALQKTGVIAGRILDPFGEPLQDVSVRAVPRNSPVAAAGARPSAADLLRQNGRTNDLGEFRLYGLTPGEYLVVASPQPFGLATGQVGMAMLPDTYYPGTPDASAAQVLVVGAGQTVSVDFAIFPARTFTVSGVVVDETGAPVPEATVTIAIDSQANGLRDEPLEIFTRLQTAALHGGLGHNATAYSDASGAFVIANVPSGAYYATAVSLEGEAAGDQAESPGVGQTAAVRLLKSASDPVQVVVSDADVDGVRIVVSRPQ